MTNLFKVIFMSHGLDALIDTQYLQKYIQLNNKIHKNNL